MRGRSDYDSLREDIDEVKEFRKDDNSAIWAKLDKHDERLSALERWQMFCYGIAATIGAAAAWLLQKLGMKE